jgi:hypothetical protein
LWMPMKDRGFSKLVINFGKVTYLDSITMSDFIYCYQIFKNNRMFVLAEHQSSSKRIFSNAETARCF